MGLLRPIGLAIAATMLALAMPGGPGAFAQDLKLADFAGAYHGGGVAEGRDNVYFTITARDLDVAIRTRDGGFDLTWTTISHRTQRHESPSSKSETISFVATERPNVFRAAEPVEPLDGEAYYWARISGRTLTVYAMTIAGNGAYELTTWARTLTSAGMDLTFSRISDGEAVRTVRGKLVRVGP